MFKAGWITGWITGWYVKKQGGPPCFPALGRPLGHPYDCFPTGSNYIYIYMCLCPLARVCVV